MHRSLLTSLLFGLLCLPVLADTLDVPEPKKETFSVTLPGRGMTMEQVEERFGNPKEKHQAVGTPPITSWVYADYTVYFEANYVIHAVFHKPK